MPVSKKKRNLFIEYKRLSDAELATTLAGTDNMPWFKAVMQVIAEKKSESMDLISISSAHNNPLAMSHGAGGMDFADSIITDLRSYCAPKPE